MTLLLVGVGGQGVVSAAKMLARAALAADRPVVAGQLHGMSQRGGSVEAVVRFGDYHTSFLEPGEAEMVVGMEPLEVLRARPFMSKRTRVLMHLQRIVPYTLAQKGEPYPPLDELIASVREIAGEVEVIEAVPENGRVNILMLGALAKSGYLPFDAEVLWSAIAGGDVDRVAFELGLEALS